MELSGHPPCARSAAHAPLAARRTVAWPLLLTLGLVALESVAILVFNDGVFTYTLDDPYIHLALAENIATGHYGVNENETSSPSSSIAWPFLLAPFARSTWGHFAPLALNVVCLVALVFVFAGFLERTFDLGARARDAFTFGLILATNGVGLALTGMEHSLQVLLVATIATGLVRVTRGETPPRSLLFALFAAPLVRYECLAITVPALAVLVFLGHRRAASTITVASLGAVIAFSFFLRAMAGTFLPCSVLVKSRVVGGDDPFSGLLRNVGANLASVSGIACVIGVSLLAYVARAPLRPRPERALALGTATAVVLHLVFGRHGWYHRYEIYAWTFLLLIELHLFRTSIADRLARGVSTRTLAFGIGAGLFACQGYLLGLFTIPISANNIYEQQYQMRRFALSFHRGPVAVNDLGLLSYRNEGYVLDLWGLASKRALEARHHAKDPAWMDALARRSGVKLAMLYERWFDEVPKSWLVLGRLRLGKPRIALGDDVVTFYALDPATHAIASAQLDAFRSTLPRGVVFEGPHDPPLGLPSGGN